MMYGKFALSASIAITVAGLAPPAFGKAPMVAATPSDGPGGHVGYADLDLTSIGGQNALRARVNTAVRNMCASLGDRQSGTFAEINCRSASQKGVDPQIARAVQRANELAATGMSLIPAVAIVLPK